MKDFKGTKGEWEVCEHSWSDTSILCGEKTIATKSIYHEATEEAQEELENEVTANFKLIAAAPELLEHLNNFVNAVYVGCSKIELNEMRIKAERIINKAIGL